MEKLQAAIEKARQKRLGDQTAPAPRQADSITPKPAEPAAPTSGASGASGAADWSAIPEIAISEKRAFRNRLFLNAKSAEATHFDKLRTKILQRARDNGWRRMLITSANKGSGKTTIAANLAASFTRQRDRRMILMDLDMRRPALSKVFDQHGSRGMADVLEGHAKFEEIAVRLGATVAIGLSYDLHVNPAQLLLQDRTSAIFDEIEARLAPDLLVLDTPPLLATDDTMALLKLVDCALIVAAAEQTTIHEIDTVEKEIAEITNVMGVVLNKSIYNEPSQGYYKY